MNAEDLQDLRVWDALVKFVQYAMIILLSSVATAAWIRKSGRYWPHIWLAGAALTLNFVSIFFQADSLPRAVCVAVAVIIALDMVVRSPTYLREMGIAVAGDADRQRRRAKRG